MTGATASIVECILAMLSLLGFDIDAMSDETGIAAFSATATFWTFTVGTACVVIVNELVNDQLAGLPLYALT